MSKMTKVPVNRGFLDRRPIRNHKASFNAEAVEIGLSFSRVLARRIQMRPVKPNKHGLNDRFIGDLQPRSKPYLVWDTMQHGLVVQVQPTGHRSFKCIYSHHGRSQWYHLSNTTAIKVADARKLALKIMVQVADKRPRRLTRYFSAHYAQRKAGLDFRR